MPFKSLGLTDIVVRAVEAAGYETPTEIQSRAIPPALAGRDIIGRAQTGTGKTAAFALPIVDALVREGHTEPDDPKTTGRRRQKWLPGRHATFALIITPTRELAHQIDEAFTQYGRYSKVKTLTVYGGMRIDKQISKLRDGVDVVIATPGRLLDHMNRGTINLSTVRMFVLDEVDRMFDMGFIQDIRNIVAALPKDRQTLLFSATISAQVRSLASRIQHDPVVVEVGDQTNPIETVRQHVFPTQSDRKLELLAQMLEDDGWDMVLVFTATKDGADFVTRRLQHRGVDASQLHSNLMQRDRQKAMERFKMGEHRVLVATDIAARGIDVEGISHVVNYDVPRYAEDYIHRIGRTGRAEATGDAVTFVGYEEEEFLSRIEEFIGKKFERKTYDGFDHGVVKLAKPPTASSHRRRMGRGHVGKKRYK